mgnify:CR=1 FL=1
MTKTRQQLHKKKCDITGHTYDCNNLTIFKYAAMQTLETEITQICENRFEKIREIK